MSAWHAWLLFVGQLILVYGSWVALAGVALQYWVARREYARWEEIARTERSLLRDIPWWNLRAQSRRFKEVEQQALTAEEREQIAVHRRRVNGWVWLVAGTAFIATGSTILCVEAFLGE